MNTDVPIRVGAVLAGKYRVERILGAGTMGVVVAATHVELLEWRAIKFMRAPAIDSPEGVERFFREARAVARLKSRHVAALYDIGRLDDGAPYLVMEYLSGADMKSVLTRRGSLPWAEAAMYLTQACEALGEAHDLEIVHRDLKPANLFLTTGSRGEPFVKVLDFGLAKVPFALSAGNKHLTPHLQMLGTPAYMSPEQVRSTRNADARSDVWSLGVILYRMLTGTTPFAADSVPEVCAAVVGLTPARPRSLRRDLPAGLDAIVMRCLEKDPARRFANARELGDALALFAMIRNHRITPPAYSAAPPPARPRSAPHDNSLRWPSPGSKDRELGVRNRGREQVPSGVDDAFSSVISSEWTRAGAWRALFAKAAPVYATAAVLALGVVVLASGAILANRQAAVASPRTPDIAAVSDPVASAASIAPPPAPPEATPPPPVVEPAAVEPAMPASPAPAPAKDRPATGHHATSKAKARSPSAWPKRPPMDLGF